MRQDDRGITLVEIIISIAVSAIVIGAATLFIRNALKSYSYAAATVDLQIESQVLMEQFATWVMEGNYAERKTEAGTDKAVYVIYHFPRTAPEDLKIPNPNIEQSDLLGKSWMRVFWFDGDGKLYTYLQENAPAAPPAETDSNYTYDALAKKAKDDGSLFCKHVDGFEVGINGLDWDDWVAGGSKDLHTMTVELSLKSGIQEYKLTDEINIRNAAYEPIDTGS